MHGILQIDRTTTIVIRDIGLDLRGTHEIVIVGVNIVNDVSGDLGLIDPGVRSQVHMRIHDTRIDTGKDHISRVGGIAIWNIPEVPGEIGFDTFQIP